MPSYSLATVAFALHIDRKHLENALARCFGPSASAKQGRARRLSRETVVILAAATHLHRELSVSLPAAVRIVDAVRRSSTGAVVSAMVTIAIDFAALERDVTLRLAEALETVPRPRRGRPPRVAASHQARLPESEP